MQGLPSSWEPIVADPKCRAYVLGAAWSSCSRFIAVCHSNSKTIEILDAATLERLNTFDTLQWLLPFPGDWLGFSPDGLLLTWFETRGSLTSWDLQTGGPAGTIPAESDVPPRLCFSSTYSMDGKIAAAAYRDCTICTYNLLSNTRIYSYHVSGGRIVPPIWTHGESLRFVTINPGTITIWEVEFTSIHTLAKVDSFPVPDNIDYGEEYYGRKCHDKETLFLPSLSRLAIAFRDIVLVWDAQDYKLLLNFLGNDQSTGMSFSLDGCFFACGTDGAGIHLWKDSPTGYTLHQKVKLAGYTFSRPLLSPNGDSIIAFNHSTLQLWRTADPTPSFPAF